MIDNGIILEADPAALVARVALRADDIPLGEQTVAQVKYIYIIKVFDMYISAITGQTAGSNWRKF